MSTPADPSTNQVASEDFKDQNVKYNLSKFEYDLYHDEDNIVEKVIRVKRFSSDNTEKWKIFENTKVIITLEGSKLSTKEKEFLRTVEGVNFLINQCKNGIKSFAALKAEIKKNLK
jgi:hypothetical protein